MYKHYKTDNNKINERISVVYPRLIRSKKNVSISSFFYPLMFFTCDFTSFGNGVTLLPVKSLIARSLVSDVVTFVLTQSRITKNNAV